MSKPGKSWWGDEHWAEEDGDNFRTMDIDDTPLMQPIGFIWTYKPRYRVKALSRQV